MCEMIVNTTTKTRLVHGNMPVLLGLSALLLVSSVRCIILRIRSNITGIRMILSAFLVSLEEGGLFVPCCTYTCP